MKQWAHMLKYLNWESMDPKDVSAILGEEKLDMAKASDICGIRENLMNAITDEKEANQMYGLYADEAESYGMPVFASALRAIGSDEGHHRDILRTMVDIITQKVQCR